MFYKWTAVLLASLCVLALMATAGEAGMLDIESNNHYRYGGHHQYRQPYGYGQPRGYQNYGQPSILDECSAALAEIPSKGERIAKAGIDGLSVGFLTKGLTKSNRWAAIAGGSTALVESIIMLKRDGSRRKELQAACLQLMRERAAREEQPEPEQTESEPETVPVRFVNRFLEKEVTVVVLGGNAPSPVTLSPGESVALDVPQGSGVEAHYNLTIGRDDHGREIIVPTVLNLGFGIYWVNDQYEIRNPYSN